MEVCMNSRINRLFGRLNGKPDPELAALFSDYAGQVEAINRSQAVIEFNPDGTIIRANENFLGAMGYSLEEIQGKHHRMFVGESVASSRDYEAFWTLLNKR